MIPEYNSQKLNPRFSYGCSEWVTSSQIAADLYESGVKLWRKEDLIDIERQLAQSFSMKTFTVRRIDGTAVQIKNPMFRVQKPIWSVSSATTFLHSATTYRCPP